MGVIKRQGIKNTIITYIGIIIGAINIIFIQPRLLTEEELGLTRLLYDFAYLIGIAIPLGLPNIIVKYFPYFKDRETRHNGFAGFALLMFFGGFIIISGLFFLFKDSIIHYYENESGLFVKNFMLILPFTFIVSAIAVTTTYCQALFKSTIPSFLNDIFLRLGTILITVLYFDKIIAFQTYVYLFIGLYAAELLIILAYILVIDRISLFPKKVLFEKHSPLTLFRFGLLLCIASFASIAIKKVDVIFLGTLNLKLVAVYSTAIFIATFVEVPLGALERISHTKIADNFAKQNLLEIEKIYEQSVTYLLLFGGYLFIGIVSCTKDVYLIAKLPESYVQCIDVVYIVSAGALVNMATGMNSAILFYSDYYVAGTILLFVNLVVTTVLNILLIPVFGIYGAAYACVFSSVVNNVIKYIFILRKFGFHPFKGSTVKVLLIIVLIALAGFVTPLIVNVFVDVIVKGLFVTALYFGTLYWARLLPTDILNMLPFRKREEGD